jgi:parvulin-like peptidyl-prolyl isomerase
MFTPTAGGLFGGRQDILESPVVIVNDQPITDQQVALARQNSPTFASVQEGEVGDDLQLLLIDGLIDRELLRQASAGERVSSGEVRQAVDDWRRENNVAGRQNDQAYLAAIGRMGHTDASFRRTMEEQLRQQRFIDSLSEGVAVTDDEVRSFYEANQEAYRSEERVRARQIVVEDAETAQELHARALDGEDFAALAREHSLVNPERDGAIGAGEGSTEPRPVGRAALPTGVTDAAFGLRGPGTTEVIQSGERYYVVAVEDYLPAQTQAFEEVEEEVREDALAAKRNAELERAFENLRANADIIVPEEAAYSYDDRPVARVGGHEIMASELAHYTYGNQQIQQFLTPDNASIISSFFKPTVLNQLIEEELAYQGAQDLPLTFLGSRQQVASSALNYVSQDVEVTDEEIAAYYQANQGRYTVLASAATTRALFDDEESARAFRSAVLEGESPEDAAAAQGGELEDLGTVGPDTLSPELDRALFETDDLETLEDGREVSEVLVVSEPAPVEDTETADTETADTETAEEAETDAQEDEAAAEMTAAEDEADQPAATRERYVVLVASRTPETVRPLDEVRDQVRSAIEADKRAELRQEWLDGLRERIEVEEFYAVQTEPQPFDPLEGLTDEPVDAEPADAEPVDAEPADAEPADVEPVDTETADDEAPTPEEITPTDTPADTEVTETEATETETAEVETTAVEDVETGEVEVSEGESLGAADSEEEEAPADQ